MSYLAIASMNLALAVILGAFGAHGIKHSVNSSQLALWDTASSYYFYHALGMLAIAILAKLWAPLSFKLPFVTMQLGIIFFCGSLFFIALNAPRWVGIMTPIGGGLMILSWLTLAWIGFKYAN